MSTNGLDKGYLRVEFAETRLRRDRRMITREQLISELNETLKADEIKDYCPNGLQVEGKKDITKVVTGVTASMALIDAAIAEKADAILVHHGYFWKGEAQAITGLKKRRLAKLLVNDINLIAYHLPIDVHPTLGNNVQLGKLLELTNIEAVDVIKPYGVVMKGEFQREVTAEQLGHLLEIKLQRKPLVNAVRQQGIKHIAWCTGGGQGYIDSAAGFGVDAFLTGEVSEQTIHSSREHEIDFFAAGHHATERYGVKAVGEYLATKFGIDVKFIDIHNPA